MVMKMKKFLFPLLVLIIASMISAILYFVIIETHNDWKTTTGTITNIEITQRRKNPGKYIHYYWSYSVDGVEYTGYDVFNYSGKQDDNEGDKKEIWYNPDNHSISQLFKPSPNLSVYIPFIFAVPIMLAVYHLQAQKDNKSRRW